MYKSLKKSYKKVNGTSITGIVMVLLRMAEL